MSVYPPPYTSSRALACPLDQDRPPARTAEWKPWYRADGRLIGHSMIVFSGDGWLVHKITGFRAESSLSVSTPSISEIDGERRVRMREDGSRSYWPVVNFACDEARSRWQDNILAALQAAGVQP